MVINLDIENRRECKIFFATGATEVLSYSSDGEITEADLPTNVENILGEDSGFNRTIFDGEFEAGDMRIFKIRL